jgi:hypothetical protein
VNERLPGGDRQTGTLKDILPQADDGRCFQGPRGMLDLRKREAATNDGIQPETGGQKSC